MVYGLCNGGFGTMSEKQDSSTFRVSPQLFIGGRWRGAENAETFDVVNPATEEILASVADASTKDAMDAVAEAHVAQREWAKRPPRERSEVLRRCFEILLRDRERLARIITLENGKSLTDSRAEVTYAAEFFRWFAEEAVRISGEFMRAPASGARILVQYKPAGVAVLVTPWNFPAAMGTRKIAPALAACCGVVLKPAAETPLTMIEIAALLGEAGVPTGLVNIISSSRAATVVDAMLDDPRVRVVSFTGSTETGRKILRSSARNIINPAMELGGNAPFVVFDDADVEAAVVGAMIAKMRNMGEACTAANRFFVHSKVHDLFVARLTERMGALKVGNGLAPGIDVGPMVTEAARQKVKRLVDDAVAHGARVTTGGSALSGRGYFYQPTVLTDVSAQAACFREEIFGPVAAVKRFDHDDEVVQMANDTEHGLVGYVYSRDINRALRISEGLEFGMIGLNRGLVSDPAAPFGGVKASGIGREGGREGIHEFLEAQYISMEW